MAKKTKRQKKHADYLRTFSNNTRGGQEQSIEMDSEIKQVARQYTSSYTYRSISNTIHGTKEEKIANDLFPFVRHDLLRTLIFTGVALVSLVSIGFFLR